MNRRKRMYGIIALIPVVILIVLLIFMIKAKELAILQERGHGDVHTESYRFTQSNRELDNPNRGFYYTHGFRITDTPEDFRKNLSERFYWDDNTELTLIQFNLEAYRDGSISEAGLKNIQNLFDALKKIDKQLIVRFLYDWHGENKKYEPESIDIILEHMSQVGPLINENKDQIFTLQGLFIGNWGEMNGTRYTEMEDIQALANQLAAVTEEDVLMAVRMPMFWRRATGLADLDSMVLGDGTLSGRLGLYNDGMMASWSDYGTYGDHTREEHGDFTYWNREEELAFQEELCKYVPIGGEVVNNNEYNDFENAVEDMKRMHVTYLNRDYDNNVFKKWQSVTVSEEGCFDGMDGLNYIERHMGYRLLIDHVELDYQKRKDILTVGVTMQNVGFAPLYADTDVRIILHNNETGEMHSYAVEQNIRELSGGNESNRLLTLEANIPLTGETAKTYTVYFDMTDTASKDRIWLANEQDPENYGYKIGTLVLESIEEASKK